MVFTFFTHYPSRLLRAGLLLFFAFGLAVALLFSLYQPVPFLCKTSPSELAIEPGQSLSLRSKFVESELVEVPNIEGAFSLSLNPPVPGWVENRSAVLLQLKNGGGARMVAVPGRLGLFFDESGILQFSEREDLFWIELVAKDANRFEGRVSLLSGGAVFSRPFLKEIEDPPLQKIEQIPIESALHCFAEVRWRGMDLLSQIALTKEIFKVELGAVMMNFSRDEFLTFKEGMWEQTHSPKQLPLVRIRSVVGNFLEWDSWDENAVYRRFAIPLQPMQLGAPPKVEEFFSSWRIRSEKQISCMLEKQSFLIRVGDWILKEQGRWRVVRTQEERQRLLVGERAGDLLILEKVDQKLRSARGRFISENRLQAVSFDLPVLNLKTKRESQKSKK